MAAYKVPQDVEAEDKLIGPFGFRQFIYLAIAAGAAFMCYVFYNIAPPLIIIPLPIMAGFIILALPLRKEQPMETYVLALVRFYLKPKHRRWNPDGTMTYVEIVAPKVTDQHLAKDYGADAASERIDYLARVMDSRGWALKGTTSPAALSNDIVAEAEHAIDVFDDNASVSQSFASMIAQQDQQRRQSAMEQMQRAATQPTPTPAAAPVIGPAIATPPEEPTTPPHFAPYPSAMHQRVIQPYNPTQPAVPPPAAPAPVAAQVTKPPAAPVPAPISPDIMRLASNDDLSISAIAHEAHRLSGGEEEVVIKLH